MNNINMTTLNSKINAKNRAKEMIEKIRRDPTYVDIPEITGENSRLEKLIAETLFEMDMIDIDKL